jgi:hypothetical protein
MKDWKTTLCGILAAVGTYLQNSTNPTLVFIGQILTSGSLLFLGYHSGDKK